MIALLSISTIGSRLGHATYHPQCNATRPSDRGSRFVSIMRWGTRLLDDLSVQRVSMHLMTCVCKHIIKTGYELPIVVHSQIA